MSLLDDIKKKTDFEILGDGNIKTFTTRPTVATPLSAIDVLIGGGIPLGCIVDLFGPPGSGKSSYGYECMGYFQKQYPDGLCVLIDSESSVESKRMIALGVDPSKILVLRGATLEKGYKQILSILASVKAEKPKNRVPVFILWDSLTNTSTDAQASKENVNGGGMAEAPRVNKEYLKQISVYFNEVDVMLVFINQVSSKIGMFVGSGYNESGGNSLKHNIQYKLEFDKTTTSYEDGIAVSGTGGVKIDKNKIGPTTKGFPIIIDITKGGVIDKVRSYLEHLYPLCMDKNTKGRYFFQESLYKKYPYLQELVLKKYPKIANPQFWKDIVNTIQNDMNEGGVFYDILLIYWADFISERYELQRDVIAPYREKLYEKVVKYFSDNGLDINHEYSSEESKSDDEDGED